MWKAKYAKVEGFNKLYASSSLTDSFNGASVSALWLVWYGCSQDKAPLVSLCKLGAECCLFNSVMAPH